MKKIFSGLITAVMMTVFMSTMLPASAATGTMALSPSASTIKAGAKVTVNLNYSSSVNAGAFDLSITYDTNLFAITAADIVGKNSVTTAELMSVLSGNKITISYLDDSGGMSTPAKSGTVIAMTFTAKANAAPGAKGDFGITIGSVAEASLDMNEVTVTGSGTSVSIAQPPSSVNTLESLSLENIPFTPAFDKNVTSYKAEVGFDISKAVAAYTVTDSKAKVSVSGTSLAAGKTTSVKITVTAEDGSKKVYTIQVKRAPDPNAPSVVPSSAAPSVTPSSSEEPSSIPDESELPVSEPGSDPSSDLSAASIPGTTSSSSSAGGFLAFLGANLWLVILLILLLLLLIGALLFILLGRKRDDEEEEEDQAMDSDIDNDADTGESNE